MTRVRSLLQTALVLGALLSAAACNKSSVSELPVGKPVFTFDYEAIHELLISRNEPGTPSWTARFIQNGWLGPQQVTPRWIISQAPEGMRLSDSIADGAFLRHLLDSLKGLRKIGKTLEGPDSSFGLSPPWTRLAWKDRRQQFEILLGASAGRNGERYARIGKERLVVDGSALDMLVMISGFQRTRHQRLLTWVLDDADRVTIRWSSSTEKPSSTAWSAERSTGDWVKTGTSGSRSFSKSPGPALEAIAHLQIQHFDLAPESMGSPQIVMEWLDRQDHLLRVEIDGDLRVRSSDRPNTIFQLFPGARDLLARSALPR